MFEFVKNFFRRRKIRKFASPIETSFLPVDKISVVNTVIDVQETGFDQLKEAMLSWGRKKGIKVNIYFFDFRKLKKGEQLLTSIDKTFLRKELSWIGTPSLGKAAPMFLEESDLFISLIDNGDFPIDFISKCVKARFKIGRYAYDGDVYDMIFHGGAREELRGDVCRIFDELIDFLEKIR
ncbi:MAG: hypothetical protein IKY95_02855 [Bacteroidales bacterium]|nr:hypothetical protein [Bacteroidales bacterium]